MKKALKVLGILLGAVLLAAGGFAVFVMLDYPVKGKPGSIDIKADPTPARLARGKALVSVRCMGCHYDQDTGAFTGHEMVEAPKEFGFLVSHNITKHPTKGLGRYTDGELAYLLRTGVRKDGVFTGPFMISPFLADEDLASIIAFLRSDDPWVAAKDVDDRQIVPSFLFKFLMHVAFKPLPVPKAPIVVPDASDKVALGKYVAFGIGDCFVCHSRSFKELNAVEPEKSGGFFGGGNPTRDPAGKVVRSANLTMDATGLGSWSEDEFVRAVRNGIRKDGRALRFPMIIFNDLSETEIRAVWAYLQTVPKIVNDVQRDWNTMTRPATASDGEKLYYKYACNSCHGANGVGICDVRKASQHYPTDEKLSEFIHDAGKVVPNTKMPTWNGVIAENEYPALIAFIHKLEGK